MFLFQLFAFAHFFGFGFPPLYNVFVFFFCPGVMIVSAYIVFQTDDFFSPPSRENRKTERDWRHGEPAKFYFFCGQLLNVLTAVPAAIHFGRSPLFSALTFCESCWWWMPHSPFEESSIRPDPIQSWSAHSSTRSWAAGMCLCFPTFFIRSRFGC